MPGRDYNRAFAAFEQTLGHSDYPIVQPTKRWSSASYPTLYSTSNSKPMPSAFRSPSSSARQGLKTQLFPPSPPSTSSQNDPSFGLSAGPGLTAAPPASDLSTPTIQDDLPTPANSPPQAENPALLKARTSTVSPSSYTGSFATALEDAESEDDTQMHLPLQGVKTYGHEAIQTFDLVKANRYSEPILPGPAHNTHHEAQQAEISSRLNTLFGSNRSETTSLRAKRRKLTDEPMELTFLDEDLKLPEDVLDQESPSSWLDESSSDESEEVAVNPAKSESSTHRLKTPEGTVPPDVDGSPTVDADIVDSSPPMPHKALRRTHKKDILLDESESPPATGSDKPRHSLQHKRSRVFKEKTTDDVLQYDDARSETLDVHEPREMEALPAGGLQDEPDPLSKGASAAKAVSMQPDAVHELQHLSMHQGIDSRASNATSKRGTSLDWSLAPRSSRHTNARASPFSEVSEAQIIQDATAVSLFPHHNKSLVVVEHAKSTPGSRDTSQRSSLNREKPLPALPPATPPPAVLREIGGVDSPLTNPRPPPRPPTFSATPATAVAEAGSVDMQGRSTGVPSRHLSLMQRVRVYSGSLTLPMLGRNSIRREQRTRPASTAFEQPIEEDSRLYASQRPRQLRLNAMGRSAEVESEAPVTSSGDLPVEETAQGPNREPETAAGHSEMENSRPQGTMLKRSFSGRSPASQRDGIHQSALQRGDSLSWRDRLALASAPIHRHASAGEQPRTAIEASPEHSAQDEASLRPLSGQSAEQAESQNKSFKIRRSGSGRFLSVHGLTDRFQERRAKRDEQSRQEQRSKLRNSIGPRFYVDTHAA